MNSAQARTFQAFRRMEYWLVQRPDIAALVAPLLATFSTMTATLNDAAVQQDQCLRSSKSATAEARRLRRVVVADHMRIIARVAVAGIPDVVRAIAALTMPPRKIEPEGLYASAESMADATEQHEAELVQAGLPANIVPELRVAVAQFRAAINERGQAVAQRRGATKSIQVHLNRARKLADSISPIVQKALRSDPATLAEWKQLKRVTLKGVRGSGASTEETTPLSSPNAALPAASQPSGAQE